MKKTKLICSLITTMILLCGLSVSAQESAGDFASFDAAFQSLKTSGGGTIELTANITIDIEKDAVYSLSSDAANPIVINVGAFTIIANGPDGSTNATVDGNNAILEIGDNVSILGTATVITVAKKSIVKVIGGLIQCTSVDATAGNAVYSNGGGKIWITGGTIAVDATNGGGGNPFALYVNNYMNLTIEGGIITAKGKAGVRTIRVGTNSTATISGATVSVEDGGIAVLSNGGSNLIIGDNTTVNAVGDLSTALNSDGAASSLIISRNASNVTISASQGKSYVSTNSGGIYDLRDLALTPSPANGNVFPTPGNITVTASGASAEEAPTYFYYVAGNAPVGSPTVAADNIAAGSDMSINYTDTYLKIRLGKGNWIDDEEISLHYKVTTVSSVVYVNSFSELQNAYINSLSTPSGTATDIELTSQITIPSSFSMTPDADHPVNLNMKTNNILLTGGNTVEYVFGGSLTLTGSGTSGLFVINGSSLVNFTGGSYTVTGNGPVFQTNAGGNSKANAILRLSNSSFEAVGTNASACILNFGSNDFKEFTATDCDFKVSAGSNAFTYKGGNSAGTFNINNCTLINAGTGTVFTLGSNNNTITAVIDGLELTMASGNVFAWTGNKTQNTIIKDLTNPGGNAVVSKPSAGAATNKFYDFRHYAISATPQSGQATSVTLSSDAEGNVFDAADAVIRYTIDGTEPTTESSLYTGPIDLTSLRSTMAVDATVKVAMEKDGFMSKSVEFSYGMPTSIDNIENGALQPVINGNNMLMPESGQYVQIFNVSGQLVLNVFAADNTVDVSSLNKGVWIVRSGKSIFKVVK